MAEDARLMLKKDFSAAKEGEPRHLSLIVISVSSLVLGTFSFLWSKRRN